MPNWPIREPSPHLADLFRRYRAGEPYTRYPLVIALYRHRGTRFVTESEVFWLYKKSDRDDDAIGFCARSIPLTEREIHEHRHTARSRH